MLKHITLADYMKEYAFSRLRELNTDIEPHQEAIIQSWISFESIHFYTNSCYQNFEFSIRRNGTFMDTCREMLAVK